MHAGPAFADAVRLHRAGRLADAAAAYRAILAQNPRHADALHLLGVIAMQQGDAAEALRLIGEAVALSPSNAIYLGNLATVHLERGECGRAIALYRQALAIDPRHVDACYNLGNALRAAGDAEDAVAQYRRAIALAPEHRDARLNLAVCLAELGRVTEAIATLEAALRDGQDSAELQLNLGAILHKAGRFDEALAAYGRAERRLPRDVRVLNGKGAVYADLGRVAEAEQVHAAALAVDPDNPDTLLKLGNLRALQGQLEEAEALYRRILARQPKSAPAHENLALLLSRLWRHQEALAEIDKSLELRPRHADSWSNRGYILRTADRLPEALAAYDKALSIAPEHAEARIGRAMAALLLGRFEEGWRDYRARLEPSDDVAGFCRTPLPDSLAGRHVVVVRDQGLGDELFFLRFAAEFRRRGAAVTYLADARLTAMLRRAAIVDRILAAGEDPGPADFHVAVGDLPHVLGHAAERFPLPFPIPVLADREAAAAERLAGFGPPPYVGVTWRAGTPDRKSFLYKEAPRELIAAALRPLDARIVLLQRGADPAEIAAFAAELGRPVLDLSSQNADLEAMLALLGLLDEYLCVSNTNVHLRAARGRTCRVLVPYPPEFRWMRSGDESPWFPGTSVYRQGCPDGWGPAFERLTRDLASALPRVR